MQQVKRKLFIIVFGIYWVFSTTMVFSDRLLMPKVDHANTDTSENVSRPTRTMSMADVIKTFGEPQQKSGPVGKPPITRWSYQKYIVVFESQYVIHSVLKSKLPKNTQ